jgi:hypothetical protein
VRALPLPRDARPRVPLDPRIVVLGLMAMLLLWSAAMARRPARR